MIAVVLISVPDIDCVLTDAHICVGVMQCMCMYTHKCPLSTYPSLAPSDCPGRQDPRGGRGGQGGGGDLSTCKEE